MICSTIVPTFNREQLLARAVNSVLEQLPDQDNYEIIVVNDAGTSLGDADWQKSRNVTLVHTNRCERSSARNVGAAIAKGEWLHFLDDDDYVLPGAYASLLNAARRGDYVWIYGHYEIETPDGRISQITPRDRGNIFALLVCGAGIPFDAAWVRRDAFYRAGCYDPLISVTEDRDLGRRFALLGDICYVPYCVCRCLIEHSTTTTDWSHASEYDRICREKVLDMDGAVARLRASLQGNVRMRGGACRAYVGSAGLNLGKSNYLRGASRLLASIRLAGLFSLTPEFWRGFNTRGRPRE